MEHGKVSFGAFRIVEGCVTVQLVMVVAEVCE